MKGNEGWKKTKTILFVTFLLTISITPLIRIMPIKADTGYVESSDSLQDKINESQNGDLIQINNSISLTRFININKSIIIQGKTGELIQINGSGFGLNIAASNVTIKNITLFNCSTALNIQNQTNPLENITIENVTITNCSIHGIYVCNATHINISESGITNRNSSGIYFNNVSTSFISNNFINQSTNTALNLTNTSNDNNIYNNSFKNNSIAINITSSQENTIYNNTFLNSSTFHAFDNSSSNNWNTTTYGNYWDDYQGTDADNDDVGDSNYTNIIGGSNIDEKPRGFFVPIANFTYEPSSPSTANTITFTDNSTDPNYDDKSHLNFTWNFDDGNSSYEINPTHCYSDNGTYNVSVTVTNNYGQSNITNQTITVTNLGATASFSYTPSVGIVNESVMFTSICSDSDGAISTYNWSFGDETYSEGQNPSHIFNQTGDYIVLLNVTDDDSNTTSCNRTITITFRPTANFTADASNPTTSDIISFTDTSTDTDGSISTYNWSFGDGSYSESQNPTHSYDDDGPYTVTLNVTDDDGATDQTSQTLTILNTPPTANFSYSPQNATDLESITFTNCSSDSDGYIANCTWTFGDGTTNYSMNATSHQYSNNGTYTVTLNVTDDDGDTDEYSVNITILNVGPTADFTFEPSCPEVGGTIWFNDTSSDQDGLIANWSWDFDDNSVNYSQNTSNSYSSLTSHDVSLTVIDNDGNISTVTKHIILKKTTIKSIDESESELFDLKDEADTDIFIKTSDESNLSVTIYSEKPTDVEERISNYENLETYLEITLENETVLEWINFTSYYTEGDINDDIDETSLTLFYWNGTSEEWIAIPHCVINTIDTDRYSGFVQANISHLTLFTIAGKIIEEDDTPTPTLPNIVNSSNNTTFSTSMPVLTITYDKLVPTLTATINQTLLLISTIDNKTFSIFIHTDLQNGNYSVKLLLSNSTLSRTDTIHFTIQLPTPTQNQGISIEIPTWMWYTAFIFIVLILIIYTENKTHVFKNMIYSRSKSDETEVTKDTIENQSQSLFKDTLLTLHRSIKMVDNTIFGSDDPWTQTKADINQTMYNIDLFTDEPDAYVGIQNQLLTEQTQCMEIINVIKEDDTGSSIEKIKEESNLNKEELSKEISILLKYGLIKEQDKEVFKLTKQARKILNKK